MTPTQIWLTGAVGLYLAGMLAIGFWTSRKIRDTKDYIIAGGRLGGWLSVGTLFATWFGAETCLGSSRTAYEKGILGIIADPFGAGLCLVLAGIFFAKVFHRMKVETIIDFFEQRFGKKVAWGMSLLYLPVYLGWVGGQLLAFGLILNALTGIPALAGILVSTVVVLVYTYWGGMWADSVTDLVQMFFIVLGLVVLFPILLSDVGGWRAVRAGVPEEFFHFYPRGASPVGWLNYVQAWMMVGIGSLPAQDLFQRMLSPKTEKLAKTSSLVAGFLYVTVGLLPVLLGIAGRLVIPAESRGDSILIDLALKYLPLPLMALMVGALLSAIMSSADSALLAPAGIIGHNLVAYLKPDASENLKLQWCRWSILIVGISSLTLALYFQNIYTLCMNSWGILLVGVAAPMMAGVGWPKANACGAAMGAVSGIASWILFSLFLSPSAPSHLFGFLVSALALVIASLLTQKKGVYERNS